MKITGASGVRSYCIGERDRPAPSPTRQLLSDGVLLLAVGCVTGVLAGLLGAGGGFATVVLLLAAGADPQVAVGTSLVYLMVMGGWGTFVHLRLGSADRRLVVAIGVAAAAGAAAGAEVAEALARPGPHPRSRAVHRLRRRCLPGLASGPPADHGSHWPRPSRWMWKASRRPARATAALEAPPQVDLGRGELTGAVAGGGVIGVLKGVFGVGAGFLIVPIMVSVGRIPRPLAVTSSLFAILVASLAGSLLHLFLGNIDWGGLAWLIPGGLFGSFVGARAAQSMSPAAVRRLFLVAMASSSIYLIALASSYR